MNQSAQQEPQGSDPSDKPSQEDADQASEERPEEGAEEEAPREPLTRVECPAAKGYDNPAVRVMIVAVVAVFLGLWCAYGAFILQKYEHVPLSEDLNKWLNWTFNTVGPFVLIPLGVFLAVWSIRRLQKVLVADEEGIGYVGREKIAWADITELNGKRVEKGLLTLTYGQDEELVLDSWKLKNFRDLVAIVEQHVPEDKQVK